MTGYILPNFQLESDLSALHSDTINLFFNILIFIVYLFRERISIVCGLSFSIFIDYWYHMKGGKEHE